MTLSLFISIKYLMAIKRCPYCKAIIDEDDKYCDNCGTQLLFPEDEFVEEEIPGDKIVDEKEPEEESTEDEATEEQELEGEFEDEEEFLEDEEEGHEEEVEEEESESVTPEREFDDVEQEPEVRRTGEVEEAAETDESDTERRELEKETGPGESEPEPEPSDKEREEEEIEEEEEEFQAPDVTGNEEPVEPGPVALERATSEEPVPPPKEIEARQTREEEPKPERPAERKQDSAKMYEVSLEDDDLVFKTKKLDGTIDEIIRAKKPVPDTESLPPWAHRIRETPATVEPDEEAQEEPRGASREWTTDSGIGIPEKVTQGTLPFADTRGPTATTFGQEKDHVEEGTQDVTAEGLEAGRPGSLTLKLRAKLVDWVFVTVLWAISLYFTAQVLDVSFFRLLFGSPVPVLFFYVILLGLYFFLFLYFLGETLGDHYFSE